MGNKSIKPGMNIREKKESLFSVGAFFSALAERVQASTVAVRPAQGAVYDWAEA